MSSHEPNPVAGKAPCAIRLLNAECTECGNTPWLKKAVVIRPSGENDCSVAACGKDAPAEVGFLENLDERLVETADFVEDHSGDAEGVWTVGRWQKIDIRRYAVLSASRRSVAGLRCETVEVGAKRPDFPTPIWKHMNGNRRRKTKSRVGAESLDKASAHIGGDCIVVIQEKKVFPGRTTHSGVSGDSLKGILFQADIMEARIRFKLLSKNVPRIIGRMIIHDYAFQVHAFACKHRPDAPMHHGSPVEGGNDNGKQWGAHGWDDSSEDRGCADASVLSAMAAPRRMQAMHFFRRS